jgi:hypothetical protein
MCRGRPAPDAAAPLPSGSTTSFQKNIVGPLAEFLKDGRKFVHDCEKPNTEGACARASARENATRSACNAPALSPPRAPQSI